MCGCVERATLIPPFLISSLFSKGSEGVQGPRGQPGEAVSICLPTRNKYNGFSEMASL